MEYGISRLQSDEDSKNKISLQMNEHIFKSALIELLFTIIYF